jgi:hypothetical protein
MIHFVNIAAVVIAAAVVGYGVFWVVALAVMGDEVDQPEMLADDGEVSELHSGSLGLSGARFDRDGRFGG